MRKILKNYFVPHEKNNYHPAFLATKRTIFYSTFFVLMKMVVIVFVVLIPAEAFLLPDILAQQHAKIIELTNELRAKKGLPNLATIGTLTVSADARALDMANHQYFSHHGPDNHTLSYFLAQSGYRYRVAGENLAMGFSDAEAVVNAWMKSPTHYANLVDKDFTQLGVGLESGFYNGYPTVYVVEHFGDPARVVTTGSSVPAKKKKFVVGKLPAKTATTTVAQVQGEKLRSDETTIGEEFVDAETIIFDREASAVVWYENGGSTILQVQAKIRGPVAKAVVYVNNYPIEITSKNNTDLYTGQLMVNEPADTIFRTVITPTISITNQQGETFNDTIEWKNIKLVSKTPLQKYIQAKKMLSPITNLFNVSRGLYLFFLILFSVALLVNIFVEIRKQHYYVIAQTVFMIALLVWLVYI